MLTRDGLIGPAVVEMDGERITAVSPASGPVPDAIIAPGFIDLQVNGHADIDVAGAAGPDWTRLDDLLLAQGVTGWCPTLVSAALGSYGPVLERIAEAAERPGPGPAILGAHLEGPFLGALPGAHDPRHIVDVDLPWLASLPPIVRVVTLSPELERAPEAVARLSRRGVVVSLGHSRASYEQALEAAGMGAALVTHLFNAMTTLHHRRPGLIGAALTDPRLLPTLIADGVHVHPAVILAAFRARRGLMGSGHPGIALVTDAVAWQTGGLGGLPLRRDGQDAPRRADGTPAGSALTMPRALANVVAAGVGATDALRAASWAPARVLGESDRGRLVPGARADLVCLSPRLDVLSTWVGGVEVYSAT